MGLTDEQKLKYYRNKDLVKAMIIQDATEEGHIIHGAQAINVQVSPPLRKHTEDFDVYTKKAKSEAIEMEKKLDKKFGGDFFRVEPALHKNTYKVKSNVTNSTVADYTGQGKKPKANQILGTKYAKLSAMKRKLLKTLRDEAKEFRHDKDRETLQRIRLQEEMSEW